MEVAVHHDPLTKQQIKDALYCYLYGPVQRSFKNRLDSIIIQNTLINKSGHKSFAYKGSFYSCDSTSPPRRANRLSPELKDKMDEYLKDLRDLNNNEIPFVIGYINQVLNSSNDFCDYLELFPDAIHRPIQQFIDSCPCKTKHLSDSEVKKIRQANAESVELMKARMVTNLLLT